MSPDFRESGLGKEMLFLGERYADQVLRLSTLAAKIASDNQISIKLFEKAGYILNGVLQNWIYSPLSISQIDMYLFQKLLSRDLP